MSFITRLVSFFYNAQPNTEVVSNRSKQAKPRAQEKAAPAKSTGYQLKAEERKQLETLLDRRPESLSEVERLQREEYLSYLQTEKPAAYQRYLQKNRPELLNSVGKSMLPAAHFRTNYEHFEQQAQKSRALPGKEQPVDVRDFEAFKAKMLGQPKPAIDAPPVPPRVLRVPRPRPETRIDLPEIPPYKPKAAVQPEGKRETASQAPQATDKKPAPSKAIKIGPLPEIPPFKPKTANSEKSAQTESILASSTTQTAKKVPPVPPKPSSASKGVVTAVSDKQKNQPSLQVPHSRSISQAKQPDKKPAEKPTPPPRPDKSMVKAATKTLPPIPTSQAKPEAKPSTSSTSGTQSLMAASSLQQAGSKKDLTVKDLFGPNLKQVTFQQNLGNTCYILATLDNILNHPLGEQILSKIQFAKTPNGYEVKFPGQRDPIQVLDDELSPTGTPGVTTTNKGVQVLERAYFKIPGSTKFGEFDTANTGYQRMFGKLVAGNDALADGGIFQDASQILKLQADSPEVPWEQSDLWVATRRIKNSEDKPIGTGIHYLSLRFNPNKLGEIQVVDPYHTQTVLGTYPTVEALLKDFHPELVRIKLNP